MLSRFVSAIAMVQGATSQLVNYSHAAVDPPGETYDYYFSSPIYNFSPVNTMRYIFPSDKIGENNNPNTLTSKAGAIDANSSIDADAGTAGAPYDAADLTTSEASAIWRMEIRSLTDLDTGKNYLQVTHELEANIMGYL